MVACLIDRERDGIGQKQQQPSFFSSLKWPHVFLPKHEKGKERKKEEEALSANLAASDNNLYMLCCLDRRTKYVTEQLQ